MTILDRVGDTKRIRIDASQFADELAKHIPADITRHLPADVDPVAWASTAISDLRRDMTKAGSDLNLDGRLDEMGQRIRQAVSTPSLRMIIARLERELPDTDTDRYERAYRRGRVQARSIYLGLGLAAGVTAGVVAALLLEPAHGKERRDAIGARTGRLKRDLSGRVRAVKEQARGIAVEPGVIRPEPAVTTVEEIPAAVASPSEAPPSMAAGTVSEVVAEPQPTGA